MVLPISNIRNAGGQCVVDILRQLYVSVELRLGVSLQEVRRVAAFNWVPALPLHRLGTPPPFW